MSTVHPAQAANPLYRTACQGVKKLSRVLRMLLCAQPSSSAPPMSQQPNSIMTRFSVGVAAGTLPTGLVSGEVPTIADSSMDVIGQS